MKNNYDFIGCDETGVGDFYTPIVFVAAYIPNSKIEFVESLGVKDSKKISDSKIIKIAKELLKNILYSKVVLTQKGNNTLAKFLNTNEVKLLYHYKNIATLETKIDKPSFIDQFSTINSIKGYEQTLAKTSLGFKMPKNEVFFETKAEDKVLSVACASILARYFLLVEMEEQNKKYQMTFPLGASEKVVTFGKEFVKKYGKDELNLVAKTNFKTVTKIIEPKF